jgi:hypothetical protein
MKVFSNNRELYEFLVHLRTVLSGKGAVHLSRIVESAMRQASALSTEFLGESRVALRTVINEQRGILTAEQADDVRDVIKQLDRVLDRPGPRS